VRDVTVHEHELGLTWVDGDALERASHALAGDDGRVWLVDAIDDAAALERAAALGPPAGVIELFDRHGRDCCAVAERLGVPFHPLPATLGDAPFTVLPVLDVPGWHEVALFWPARRALVAGEVVGTARHYAVGRGPAGVHPFLRLRPPASLRGFRPEHLLVGHGRPLHGTEVPGALEDAFSRTRRDMPLMALAVPHLARAAAGRWGR
jgi:hypothetical protein